MSRSQTDEISEGNLGLREVRRVYLITYSHADTRKGPSRQRFAEIVLEAFELRGTSVVQWACCKEPHSAWGIHFHTPIKLSRPQRWLLLEGRPVYFSAPKTHYAQDIAFEKDTPIFCTSKSEIVLIKGGVVDDIETQMVSVRWQVYSPYAQVPEPEQVILSPCGKCFARLILE